LFSSSVKTISTSAHASTASATSCCKLKRRPSSSESSSTVKMTFDWPMHWLVVGEMPWTT